MKNLMAGVALLTCSGVADAADASKMPLPRPKPIEILMQAKADQQIKAARNEDNPWITNFGLGWSGEAWIGYCTPPALPKGDFGDYLDRQRLTFDPDQYFATTFHNLMNSGPGSSIQPLGAWARPTYPEPGTTDIPKLPHHTPRFNPLDMNGWIPEFPKQPLHTPRSDPLDVNGWVPDMAFPPN